MYASRTIIFLLAFVAALVSAVPLHHHHRRSKCSRRAPASTQVNIDNSKPTAVYAPPSSDETADPTPSPSAGSYGTKGPKPKPTETEDAPEPTETEDTEEPTETSKSDAPAPSKSSSGSSSHSGGYVGGLLNSLFPVSDSVSSWTTCSAASDAQDLSDAVFRPTNDMNDLPHPYVEGPEGKRAMKAHYPKGSYNFQHNPKGGMSFYAPGPSNVDLTTAKEATFGYSVYFKDGFAFQKGGKLPGLYGGNSASEAIGCSGGRRDNGCFSARLMWRTDGQGEVYTYLPPDHNEGLCKKVPSSDCNPTYGASIGRGAFSFATGEWTAVSERVRLNDVGKSNGEIELFVNGKSVINLTGLVLVTSGSGKFRGMQMQSFFGGSSSDFASPKDQDVYFADFSVAITDKF